MATAATLSLGTRAVNPSCVAGSPPFAALRSGLAHAPVRPSALAPSCATVRLPRAHLFDRVLWSGVIQPPTVLLERHNHSSSAVATTIFSVLYGDSVLSQVPLGAA
ncbi:hypothetical protein GUJ93_ZPchr0002g26505 [Zizania palustris]|uniref:Uncharacterized protein n=1 Tax=Zizania palustris TaxID=103762 RepID=A0A8J5VUM3_ZIZPA|nr:hypothetical protein GUJ93_ZPchr0002g26505 [Zizania palustris]